MARGIEAAVGKVLGAVAALLALAGGAMLVFLLVMSTASILGRWLGGIGVPGLGPVRGDFEMVEMGTAFAVFSMLPWCQTRRGHVTVDAFLSFLGPRGLAWSSLIGNLTVTAVALLLAVQHGRGLEDKLSYIETTMILQLPIWWGYAAGLPGIWLFVVVSAHSCWRSLNEALDEGEPAPGMGEAH